MYVRLTNNVRLDEVPAKVAETLMALNADDVSRIIKICYELLLLSKGDTEVVMRLIDQARDKLASLDRSLADSQMILKGYNLAVNPPDDPEPEPEVAKDAD